MASKLDLNELIAKRRQEYLASQSAPPQPPEPPKEQLVQLPGFPALSSLDVVGMTWLADNVEGEFPDDWEIDGRALTDAGPVGRRMR